ncbi:ribonuclease BN [Clostridium sp. 001]|uniref:YihY/virulence factor BrkB family protein n=1 Tax=Clostridium ragsdalei TaxID=217158 RepID=UPI0007EE8BE9|nr:ribonuclease BN [Clostridium sp. 001]
MPKRGEFSLKERAFSKLKEFIFRFIQDDVLALASQLAYSLLFSIFPFLVFFISLIGYSDISSNDILLILSNVLPKNALELIENTVVKTANSKNIELLCLSLILTLWALSGGFHAVIKGLNKAYDQRETRSIFKIYIISILCTLGVTLIILCTLLFLVFGQMLGSFLAFKLGLSEGFGFLWNILRYVIIFFGTIFIFAAVYISTPNVRLTWRKVLPGAVFSTIGIVIASMGFAFYVNNFGNYSKIYGSIGAVIILLTWLFILSTITILGGEFNSVLFKKEKNRF